LTKPAFSPEIEKALDDYVVPPVPAGFSDRLLMRIANGDNGSVDPVVSLPATRRRTASPWRRTSRIVGSIAFLSLATAAAAAAGVFGNPVYVPGVSEALIEAKIVDAPVAVTKPRIRMVAEPKAVIPSPAQPAATGRAAVVNRVAELRSDPEYAKLPPRERLKAARTEVRQMVRLGEASRQDVRAAVRELAQDTDPATKEAWRKAGADRRQKRLERREALRNATPEERASMLQTLREQRQAVLTETPTE